MIQDLLPMSHIFAIPSQNRHEPGLLRPKPRATWENERQTEKSHGTQTQHDPARRHKQFWPATAGSAGRCINPAGRPTHFQGLGVDLIRSTRPGLDKTGVSRKAGPVLFFLSLTIR